MCAASILFLDHVPQLSIYVQMDQCKFSRHFFILSLAGLKHSGTISATYLNPDDGKWSSAGWHEAKNSLRPDVSDFGGLTVFFHGESEGMGAGKVSSRRLSAVLS